MKKLLFILLLWNLFSYSAHADPLKLVALQYPPYVYAEEGEIKGIATQMIRAIFDELEVEIDIEVLPWARALRALKYKTADGVFTIFKTKERLAFLDYPNQPLIDQRISIYVRQDSSIEFSGDLEPLYPHRIALTRSVSYGSVFDASRQNFVNSITVNDEISKFDLLAIGRTELLISNQDAAEYYIEKLGLVGKFRRLTPALESVPSYLALTRSPKHRALLERFEQVLNRFKSSGQLHQINKRSLASGKPSAPELRF
ncbi:ABC transporter substrate-binding protein [Motiliproteus sp. MSK22-1]|uniref:substrate-binding periplasmic protein n=1 Tax=Motiliproteus sp. MSK22-1 TaxID=1897630 RepID=UPI0009762093|nr:transporter substrate-binding domain-containing protein [Motiliproteus sp. MSK22-1]OMH33902.1 hypothetical protein BGP75_13055 [Motiliproteus sp. MSK22-1]